MLSFHLLSLLVVAVKCSLHSLSSAPQWFDATGMPYRVMIQEYRTTHPLRSPWVPICGGTLINSHWIITAASCLVDYLDRNLIYQGIRVVTGSRYQVPASQVIHRVVLVAKHHLFLVDSPDRSHDIGLIKLANEIKTSGIRLPSLALSRETFESTHATFAGFGTLIDRPVEAYKLRETRLSVKSRFYCSLIFGSKFRSSESDYFCAAPFNSSPMNACPGDRGSGLIFSNHTHLVIFGIASYFSKKCSFSGAIGFIDISRNIRWINMIIKLEGEGVIPCYG